MAAVFDVPIVYFFLPPPTSLGPTGLADTGRPLADLSAAALGSEAQLVAVTERLSELIAVCPAAGEALAGAVLGAGPDWARSSAAGGNSGWASWAMSTATA